MELTKSKSIFDIPKIQKNLNFFNVNQIEEPPKKKRRRIKKSKSKKKNVIKGVEITESRNVKGQKEYSLSNRGFTQIITINTGEQKPRGVKAKGQTVSWNMKPSKFKASRGLRDDRVYLQPPKREYFGNRYKSAMDKIMIDQKVKEAGASKNKEIADVRDRANRERVELERRERIKDDTISELRREKAGIVASHNISLRNQSRATILGGDVGELNKLIARRGYEAIRRLVMKGEITDISTILQLNLTQTQIDRLVRLLEEETSDYPVGYRLTYLTGRGIPMEGTVLSETEKYVRIRRDDGTEERVPKQNIQSGIKVAEARSGSADPSVRRGTSVPSSSDFGSPRASREPPISRSPTTSREPPRSRSPSVKPAKRRDDVETLFSELEALSPASGLEEVPEVSLSLAQLSRQRRGLAQPKFTGKHTKFEETPEVLEEEVEGEVEEEETRPQPEPEKIVEDPLAQTQTPSEYFLSLATPSPSQRELQQLQREEELKSVRSQRKLRELRRSRSIGSEGAPLLPTTSEEQLKSIRAQSELRRRRKEFVEGVGAPHSAEKFVSPTYSSLIRVQNPRGQTEILSLSDVLGVIRRNLADTKKRERIISNLLETSERKNIFTPNAELSKIIFSTGVRRNIDL